MSMLPNNKPNGPGLTRYNNRKDEYKAACWELRGKYELKILI